MCKFILKCIYIIFIFYKIKKQFNFEIYAYTAKTFFYYVIKLDELFCLLKFFYESDNMSLIPTKTFINHINFKIQNHIIQLYYTIVLLKIKKQF